MRFLIRRPTDEVLDELFTALLQEGHDVRLAARKFAPDMVIERYAPGRIAGAWFARRHGLPYCVIADTPPRRSLLERLIWRTASRVLAATAALKEAITALGVGSEKIDIVPGGVVPERFLPAPFAPARGSDAVVLGWIGGGQTATAASDFSLVVIADVPPARVPDLLAGIDIALIAEPSPLRLLDCMAAGRAIVAPDHQEVRELLEHERTALLFDPAETGALARAAARLIADALSCAPGRGLHVPRSSDAIFRGAILPNNSPCRVAMPMALPPYVTLGVRMIRIGLLLFPPSSPHPPAALTLEVGPDQPSQLPSAAIRDARDGDTVRIAAGEYVDCAVVSASNLVIEGTGADASAVLADKKPRQQGAADGRRDEHHRPQPDAGPRPLVLPQRRRHPRRGPRPDHRAR